MEDEARQLGALVQSAVTSRTHILVYGDAVGEKKMEKAKERGVEVMPESAYRTLLASRGI